MSDLDFNHEEGSFLFVEWVDSAGHGSGWIRKSEFEEAMGVAEIETLGILYHQTDEYITLVMSCSDSHIDGNISIPKCSITNIRRVVFDD